MGIILLLPRLSSLLLPLAFCFIAASSFAQAPPAQPDIALFKDGIMHWQKRYGRDRNDARYEPSQFVEIAENLLRYQNPDGGWPKDLDWLAKIEIEEVKRLKGDALKQSTFDNRNIYPQIEYLSQRFKQKADERYLAAARRGLDYIFHEQRPTGGWRGADVDAITYNDEVMTGVMNLLQDILERKPEYDWVDEAGLKQAKESLARAVEVTLKCQIVVDGKKTGWCEQHDHATFAPVGARAFELAAICPEETTDIVRFFMRLPSVDDRMAKSMDAAVKWLESVKIMNTRIERFDIPPARFDYHTATQDLRVVSDPQARPIWARFYEIGTNRPFFCNRDGIKVFSLDKVLLERRTGAAWYGYWPEKLLKKEYPRWVAGREKK